MRDKVTVRTGHQGLNFNLGTFSDTELRDALRGSSLMSCAILELGSVGIDPDRIVGRLFAKISAFVLTRPRSPPAANDPEKLSH